MRRRKLQVRTALAGLFAVVAVLVAGTAALRAAAPSWPQWAGPTLAAAGVLLLFPVVRPLLRPRPGSLTQRARNDGRHAHRQDDTLEGIVGARGGLPLVRDVNDRGLLGIHPAIPLPPQADQALSLELPSYVPRDVDTDLHEALRAKSASGGFVLLVGRAASGKTRCAYEAINAVLGDWRLCMPTSADQLTSLVNSDSHLARTVVWLNETQRFLGPGTLAAETVRRLLIDPRRPVVLVGTIWSEHYTRLRASIAGEDGRDLNRDSREILELAHRFTMPDEFSDAERRRAEGVAGADPRIQEALNYGADASPTAVLASAPELIHRWVEADNPYGAAIISAAVDARCCGHPEPLPASLLKALAAHHLTGAQRANAPEDWFSTGSAWACEPVRGTTAPLTPHAAEIGTLDGYRVADILVQRAQIKPQSGGTSVSERQWALLIDRAGADACLTVGVVAYYAGLAVSAKRAWMRAADGGNSDAMAHLGTLLAEEGDIDEARRWYGRAADHGNVKSMVRLGILLAQRGAHPEAHLWLRRGADRGNTDAMVHLGTMAEQRSTEEARAWYRRAVDGGNTDAMTRFGLLLARQGNVEGALSWYRSATDDGNTDAMVHLGQLLTEQGDIEEAGRWYQRAADEGDTCAMTHLGLLLARQGHTERARVLQQRAADHGDTEAMTHLGLLLADHGDADEGHTWLQRAADNGNTDAMVHLGLLLAQQGDNDQARNRYETAADHGNTNAMVHIGTLLVQQGDASGACAWYERLAHHGHTDAMRHLGLLLTEHGDPGEGHTWLQRAADNGNTDAMVHLGLLLAQQGDVDGARAWYERFAHHGHTVAMWRLSFLLTEHGDPDEGHTWLQRAADNGNTDAMVRLGLLLADGGDDEQARTWYQRAADNGNTRAMTHLGLLLADQADVHDGRIWLLRAAANGNTDAMVRLGLLLADGGDDEQARTWHRRALDDSGPTPAEPAPQTNLRSGRSWFRRAAQS